MSRSHGDPGCRAGSPGISAQEGEEGLSVFRPDSVDPPLDEAEILGSFRPGSIAVVRSVDEIEAKGLTLVSELGSDSLPARLQTSHALILPGLEMTRSEFKQALKELE
jgi:hypothetical protein